MCLISIEFSIKVFLISKKKKIVIYNKIQRNVMVTRPMRNIAHVNYLFRLIFNKVRINNGAFLKKYSKLIVAFKINRKKYDYSASISRENAKKKISQYSILLSEKGGAICQEKSAPEGLLPRFINNAVEIERPETREVLNLRKSLQICMDYASRCIFMRAKSSPIKNPVNINNFLDFWNNVLIV